MQNSSKNKAVFITEVSIIFVIMVMVISVLSSFFMMCRSRSIEATVLNDAVLLAANVAEAAGRAEDEDELSSAMAAIYNSVGHSSKTETGEDGSIATWAIASSDFGSSQNARRYIMLVTRPAEDSEPAGYVRNHIAIYEAGPVSDINDVNIHKLGEPVYELDTGAYTAYTGKEASL